MEYKRIAFLTTFSALFFGILALILMLVWLLHYREGIEYESRIPARVFNVHPFLMFFGFVFLVGEAMMAYKLVKAKREVQKLVHMIIHTIALSLGIVGICSVFKFHDMIQVDDLYSLHSWIGITTISLFALQWLCGLVTFMVPAASDDTKSKVRPWHVHFGRAIFFMSICAALTGLIEKFTFLKLTRSPEARVINFTALAILLFGIFVDASVTLARHV